MVYINTKIPTANYGSKITDFPLNREMPNYMAGPN